MARKKKGFLSIELVLVGAFVLIFAVTLIYQHYPEMIRGMAPVIVEQTTRFDKLPEGVVRIP